MGSRQRMLRDKFFPSLETIKIFARYGVETPAPWNPKPRLPNKVTNQEIFSARIENKMANSCLNDEEESIIRQRAHSAQWCDWVVIDDVIDYLRRNGIEVICLKAVPGADQTTLWPYMVNNKPVSASGLLLLANRLRESHGLTPMLVEGITQN